MLAPGHDSDLPERFVELRGASPGAPRRAVQHDTPHPAIRADPFCVQELDGLLSEHDIWIEPEALELLQEVREQHARAAGLVALSEATDATSTFPAWAGS